jgi:hypothetical protein
MKELEKRHKKMTIFKHPNCTLHMMAQLYQTVLHKYMNCSLKWNGEKVKIGGIEIV